MSAPSKRNGAKQKDAKGDASKTAPSTQKRRRKRSSWYVVPRWVSWVIFLLLLASPLLLRHTAGAPLLALDKSYDSLLDARSVLASWPDLTSAQPFDYLLAASIYLLGDEARVWVLPLLLGILSFLLLDALLPRLMPKKVRGVREYALLLGAITPLLSTTFTTLTPLALFLPIFLIAMHGFVRRHLLLKIIGGASLALLPLLLPIEGLITLILLACYGLLTRRESYAVAAIITSIPCLLFAALNGWHLTPVSLVPGFFGELGGLFGFSLFIIILTTYEIMSEWKPLDKRYTLVFLLLFIASIWLPGLRLVILAPLLLYGAHGLVLILRHRWSIQFLHHATLLLLLCLGLFVALTHVQLLAAAQPGAALRAAMGYITEHPEYRGSVVTTSTTDAMVVYFSEAPAAVFSPKNKLFSGITIGAVTPALAAVDARYLLATPAMRDDTWRSEDEGLLFLMNHNDKFIKVFNNEGYELWLFLHEYAPQGDVSPERGRGDYRAH